MTDVTACSLCSACYHMILSMYAGRLHSCFTAVSGQHASLKHVHASKLLNGVMCCAQERLFAVEANVEAISNMHAVHSTMQQWGRQFVLQADSGHQLTQGFLSLVLHDICHAAEP